MEDYINWTREKLIEHITAYGSALHELASVAMAQEHEIRRLKARLEARESFHAA